MGFRSSSEHEERDVGLRARGSCYSSRGSGLTTHEETHTDTQVYTHGHKWCICLGEVKPWTCTAHIHKATAWLRNATDARTSIQLPNVDTTESATVKLLFPQRSSRPAYGSSWNFDMKIQIIRQRGIPLNISFTVKCLLYTCQSYKQHFCHVHSSQMYFCQATLNNEMPRK